MYKKNKILALVPARSGSKGIPHKNIKPLLGKPLIAWTIEEAKRSKYIDRIIVSTDDEEIADISKRYGAEVPLLRPKELAMDNSSSIDVILHALNYFDQKKEDFNYLALLEPTSPLRETDDIDKGIELLIDSKIAKSIVSVAKLESAHPKFNVIIDERTNFIRKLDGGTEFKVLRRQDLPGIYFFDGTIYISEIKSLIVKKTFYHELTLAYIVPRWKSLEIDELSDFICAEALLKARMEGVLK